MIAQRHRVVAATLVHELAGRTKSAHLSAAVHAADQLTGLDVFDMARDHFWETSKILSQVAIVQGGSTKPQQGYSVSIANET